MADATFPETDGQKQGFLKRVFSSAIVRAVYYLIKRLLSIAITIIFGVFVTVLIANHPMGDGLWDGWREMLSKTSGTYIVYDMVEADYPHYGIIDRSYVEYTAYMAEDYIRNLQLLEKGAANVDDEQVVLEYIRKIYNEFGLGLPALPRQFSRAWEALLSGGGLAGILPYTLLLIGTAYFFVFLIGIPLSLRLSQKPGSWLDKVLSVLAPLSSIPSWVIGILLVMIFAVELHWFPVSGIADFIPPETEWQRFLMLVRHLILPAMAIFLSAIFQLTYTWKTFLSIYAGEDYVELGKAKGLSERILGRKYILRPTLPYMLTSFVLTLVGVWQSVTVLEYYFDWPGIGNLFIQVLPNWNSESVSYGSAATVVGIVVLFAYLLGAAVFVLDILYVLVDPRLRLAGQGQTVRLSLARSRTRNRPSKNDQAFSSPGSRSARAKFSFNDWKNDMADWAESIRPAWVELKRSPSAMIGLVLVILLVASSVFVVFALPYQEYGRNWYLEAMPKVVTVPRLAMPIWVNWFRKANYPSTILLDSAAGQAEKTAQTDANGFTYTTLTYAFEYPYNDFPQDILIYFQIPDLVKRPFVTFTWITPDGREFSFNNASIEFSGYRYDVRDNMTSYRRMVTSNEHWSRWFVMNGDYQTPSFYVLFADPDSDTSWALDGTYTLTIDITSFEPLTPEQEDSMNANLILLGQVYGAGGTDSMRRDLTVPLLWGLPYALLIGLAGAVGTTLLSLLVAATAAWLGGFVDGLLQKLIEANIILPVLAIATLFLAFFHLDMWMVLGVIIVLNTFGSPTKSFRAAFLQIKEASYIEAAQAYGASNWRIISKYFIPRILPVIIPQIVILIPSFVFLEATLGIFGVTDPRYPTWGKVLFSAIRYGATYGSRYWVLQPIALLLLTCLAFVLLGFTLNRILNPRLMER